MTSSELDILIEGCKRKDASSQKKLFMHMYNYGMSIAQKYAGNLQEAEEIANDGFYKVLKNIDRYQGQGPFLVWVRRVIINCGIDHYRKNSKKEVEPTAAVMQRNVGESKLDSDYLLAMVQKLSPQYRMVFVLHVIEGYTHDEIAEKLEISKGTSKSNLSKAKKRLQEMVEVYNKKMSQYGR